MKFKHILIVAVALCSCSQKDIEEQLSSETSSSGQTITTETEEEIEAMVLAGYVKGVNYLRFGEDMTETLEADLSAGVLNTTKSAVFNEAVEELGVVSIERLFPKSDKYEGRARRSGLHRWYKVTYDESVSVTEAADVLAAVDGVEEVECVPRIVPLIFNDPLLIYQWHYGTASAKYGINLQKAWDNYTVGSSDVIVAIIDGGLQTDHPDLATCCLSEDEGAKSFVSGYDLTPMNHGTHVGGIVGAMNNNSVGMCGIAGGDFEGGVAGVELLSCMVFVEKGDDTISGDMPSAIIWAADHGAVIAQNSWGYSADYNGDGTISSAEEATYKKTSIPSSLQTAIEYFIEYAGCDDDGNQLEDSPMKGGLVVFSAGNDALDYGVPGYYESVLAVGATTNEGEQADYSSYGDWVDIAAPGTSIYSTVTGSTYASMSGTSMAAPHVSGVAALLLSQYGGEGYTPDKLWEALINGANYDVLPSDSNIGPLLDAYGSLAYVVDVYSVPPVVSSYSVSSSSNSIDFTWTVNADDDGLMADNYIALVSEDSSLLSSITDYSDIPTGVFYATKERGDATKGTTLELNISDLEFGTLYYVAMGAYNDNGNCAELSSIKSITTTENNPPEFSFSVTGTVSVHAHETVSVTFTVTDPDGDEVTVSLKSDSGGAVSLSSEGDDEYELLIGGSLGSAGTYSAVLYAEDEHGKSSTYTLSYQLLANHAPTLTSSFSDAILSTTGDVLSFSDLDSYFSDEDGETLSYSASSSDDSIVKTVVSGTSLTLTAVSYGTVTITVTATDTLGESVSTTFKILVRGSSATVDAYPNPVKTTLYVRTGLEEKSTRVKLVSETGTTVYSKTAQTSAFSPLAVDVSRFSAGKYVLTVVYDGTTYEISIVKL